MAEESKRSRTLRDVLKAVLLAELDEVYVNGSMEHRLPHNLNVSFGGIDAEALMLAIDDVALSSGSACLSRSREPSYVLRALGVREDLAQNPIRFGLGRFNTREEVEYVSERVVETVKSLREVSLEMPKLHTPT
jgi:cysteine desulfurase